MGKGRFDHLIVPVAAAEDAERTALALAAHLTTDQVTVVHVVEKAGGAPDKAGVEQREAAAEAAFDRFRQLYDGTVETAVVYDTNVADGLVSAAADAGADAIAFTPRGGGWFARVLTGNITRDLIDDADRPIIVVPEEGSK
ncbi:universal stress protein [Halosegnis sp.]|uniref:universal stress protein n=1 Tax=Halosegnis sp. TaxID=2864959 RepID=UPI0035D4B9DD